MNRWKLALLTMSLGFSANVFAGSFGCTNGHVTIPCFAKGWHFLVEGQYLQHTNDDSEYVRNTEYLAYDHYRISDAYKGAFRLEAGYHFGQGNDITADWNHFSDNLDGTAPLGPNVTAHGNGDFHGNIFDIEFGQVFKVLDHGDLRAHFGAQIFRLDHHLMTRITEVGEGSSAYTYVSNFHAVGPRFGVDWSRPLPHGFTIIAEGAGALLAGDFENAIIMHNQGNSTPYIAYHKRRAVVPALEARSVVRWSHVFDKGVVSFEFGWHYAGYFQTVHHLHSSTDEGRPVQNISNFSHQGPIAAIMFSERV